MAEKKDVLPMILLSGGALAAGIYLWKKKGALTGAPTGVTPYPTEMPTPTYEQVTPPPSTEMPTPTYEQVTPPPSTEMPTPTYEQVTPPPAYTKPPEPPQKESIQETVRRFMYLLDMYCRTGDPRYYDEAQSWFSRIIVSPEAKQSVDTVRPKELVDQLYQRYYFTAIGSNMSVTDKNTGFSYNVNAYYNVICDAMGLRFNPERGYTALLENIVPVNIFDFVNIVLGTAPAFARDRIPLEWLFLPFPNQFQAGLNAWTQWYAMGRWRLYVGVRLTLPVVKRLAQYGYYPMLLDASGLGVTEYAPGMRQLERIGFKPIRATPMEPWMIQTMPKTDDLKEWTSWIQSIWVVKGIRGEAVAYSAVVQAKV